MITWPRGLVSFCPRGVHVRSLLGVRACVRMSGKQDKGLVCHMVVICGH